MEWEIKVRVPEIYNFFLNKIEKGKQTKQIKNF
jgi:hypothetical protein